MAKRTPDRKVVQGGIVGVLVAAATAWVESHFHLSADWKTLIVTGMGIVGHQIGSYLAPYEPRIEEIIAYVKKLLNEVPAA